MAKLKNLVTFAAVLLVQAGVIAQSAGSKAKIAEEGFMRTEGKIYVVLAVVTTILAGLILYIVRLDRKISKLEKGGNF